MANTREIKNRMKSIQDTMKITNAMYMISSTKLRKARRQLEETEPYFFTLQNMMARLIRHLPEVNNVYLDERKHKSEEEHVIGLVVVTADKGLAGSYNHNVLKMAEEMMQSGAKYRLYVVGELGRQYFEAKGIHVSHHFHYTAQNPSLHRARVISEMLIERFKDGSLDEVHLIYTVMKNSVTAEAEHMQLLPVVPEQYISEQARQAGITQETLVLRPSPEAVLKNVVTDSIVGYIYGALVESFCSEQSARMMAMEAANKSANAMLHSLSIQYNRVRQAMITQEITEVISGAKAQKKKKKARKEALGNE